MRYGLNTKLIIELLEAHKETIPAEEFFKRKLVDEQIAMLKAPESYLHYHQRGGAHFGVIRNWMQRKCLNGEHVTWGSHTDQLKGVPPLTPALFEEIACMVAAAAVNEFKGLA